MVPHFRLQPRKRLLHLVFEDITNRKTRLFTTKSKGQGLGLAVVTRLVESLNGTIAFESESGKGTKFVVTVPQTVQA